jgi:HEAT repeat protein
MKSTAIVRHGLVFLGVALAAALAAPRAGADDKATTAPAAKGQSGEKKEKGKSPTVAALDDELLPWLTSLTDGYRRALADRKPLLILISAKWCPQCRKLAAELKTSNVQVELARWTLVALDLDAQASDAEELGVVGVPAWRLRTSSGQVVAARNGYVAPEELIEWLKKQYESAVATADDVLLGSGEPSVLEAVKLVRQFQQRNPALREAAVRRLLPYPNVARSVVLKSFQEGNLSARLTAMDLLEQWRAPLAGLDPWRPETFSKDRLAKLDRWSGRNIAAAEPPKQLSAAELADARGQIDRMLKADEAASDAIRQRLARLGPALLPEVVARLKDATADRDRRRLAILRYRLVASDALVLRWPGGLERLGDADPKLRQQAAEELAKQAGDDEKALLLELFASADPLVREISLRGLQHIGGKRANAALVKLLGDPEPNVRAAVLKQLEESPDAAMAPAVIKYLETEKDADLVVHGIRFLQAAKGKDATKCLMALLKHDSWQVRAEAAAGLGKLNENRYSYGSSSSNSNVQLQVDMYTALLALLDDPDAFVVAKAVEGLANANMALVVEPMVKVVDKHPELAASVLEILASGSNMREKAIPHLEKFCKHQRPQVRAAAITALCAASAPYVEPYVVAALEDKENEVRIAGATALLKLFDGWKQAGAQKESNEDATPIQDVPLLPGEAPPPPAATRSPGIGQLILSAAQQVFGGSATTSATKVSPSGSTKSEAHIAIRRIDGKSPAPDEAIKAVEKSLAAKSKEPPKADEKPKTEGAAKQPTVERKVKADSIAPPGAVRPSVAREKAAKKPDAKAAGDELIGMDKWLEGCYAGTNRPKWTARTIAPLEKMLHAADPKERMAAALALVPLGKGRAAMPVLRDILRTNPEMMDLAQQALPWLVWTQRLKTFQDLRALAATKEARMRLAMAFSEASDQRAAATLWDVLAEKGISSEEAQALQMGLLRTYLGERYYDVARASPGARRDLVEAAKPRTAAGGDQQRLAALSLLAVVARDDAAEIAARLADDPKLGASLRADAFQIQLLMQSEKKSLKTALAAVKGKDAQRKKLGIVYLTQGANGLRRLSNSGYVGNVVSSYSYSSSSDSSPIVPKPPEGIDAADVRPLLADADAKVAAGTGYLLVLLGEPDGLGPLLQYWRRHGQDSSEWRRMVYRAIAVADDPKYIPALREIYGKLQQHEMHEFYWTIRIMTGSEMLKFRKQIREEVGASQLGS